MGSADNPELEACIVRSAASFIGNGSLFQKKSDRKSNVKMEMEGIFREEAPDQK